jgi:hypothetical protein
MRRVMSGRTHASDDTGSSRAGRPLVQWQSLNN